MINHNLLYNFFNSTFTTYWLEYVIQLVMKNGRNTAGQFTEGNSGKPKGSRNKATIAIESLLEGQAEALTQTAISKALDVDSMALRLCMDRQALALIWHLRAGACACLNISF